MTLTATTECHSHARTGRHRSTRPRTLHLIDVENMVAGRVATRSVADMWSEFVDVLAPRWDDQATVSVAQRNAATAFLALPAGVRRVVGSNTADGADEALLDSADTEWIAGHFGRVVIGSGDHIFAPLADSLRTKGLTVVQAIGGGRCSAALYRACSEHTYLTRTRAAASARRGSRPTSVAI